MPAIILILLCCAFEWAPVNDPIRIGQFRYLLIIGSGLIYKQTKSAITRSVAALLTLMAIMWVLHDYQPHGSVHLLCFSAACLVAYFLSKHERSVCRWLSWIGMGEAAFGIAEWIGWNPWGYANAWELHKPSGTYGQETILGALLVATLAPALFSRRYYAAITIAVCAYATHSTMTACGSAAVVFLWAINEFGELPAIAAAIFCAIAFCVLYLLIPQNPWFSATGRLEFWNMGIHQWMKHPLFGWGPGALQDQNIIIRGQRLTYMHNEFLELLYEYGAMGGAIAMAGFVEFIHGFKLTWHHALVVGVLVDAFGNFPLHIASIGTIFLTAWLLSIKDRSIMLQWEGTEARLE